MLAGVCGGLGQHFNIDPVLFRIGFVVLALSGGTGLLAYVALALILPRDSDPGDPASDRSRLASGILLTILIAVAVPILLIIGFIAIAPLLLDSGHTSVDIDLSPGPGTLLAMVAIVLLLIAAARRR
jgi:phage shock protein PspC (stress-responsive transcriptional regulator)